MMASKMITNECGLIIVGNSGVGKSFLANLILNKSLFKHEFSARSVTHRTESVRYRLADRHYWIYNIPGLIEGNTERIALNRQEIQRAFEEQKSNPIIIIYVFGHQNGRIRNEDLVTFQAMHKAYTFSSDSLLIVVNGLARDRPYTYNEDTQSVLIDLLGMKPSQICFIDHLSSTGTKHENVRQYLIDAIRIMQPRVHIKTNDISLIDDHVLDLKNNLDRIHLQMNNEHVEHENTIEQMERDYQAAQRVSALRRLFCQAKVNLRQLIALYEQEEHLISVIKQWEAEEIGYEDDSDSEYYQSAVRNKEESQTQLENNRVKRRYIDISLNQYRKDIEQTCFELEQIYDGEFDYQYEPVREFYILFDDLRFDPSIQDVKHDFLTDLNLSIDNKILTNHDSLFQRPDLGYMNFGLRIFHPRHSAHSREVR